MVVVVNAKRVKLVKSGGCYQRSEECGIVARVAYGKEIELKIVQSSF
jgi:hypothetical protein